MIGGRDVDTDKVGYNLSCGAIGMNILSKLLGDGFFLFVYWSGDQCICIGIPMEISYCVTIRNLILVNTAELLHTLCYVY